MIFFARACVPVFQDMHTEKHRFIHAYTVDLFSLCHTCLLGAGDAHVIQCMVQKPTSNNKESGTQENKYGNGITQADEYISNITQCCS